MKEKKQKDGSYKCSCGLTFKDKSDRHLENMKKEFENWKDEKIEVKDE